MSIHERSPRATDLAEVILYAVPTGDVALACHEYWHRVEAAGRPTAAQTYPPHCTLTGFFRRSQASLDRVVDDLRRSVPDPVVPAGDVRSRLQVGADWVGLALDAPAFSDAVDRFVSAHRVGGGEDALRPKSWMHLSLAYADGLDAEWHGTLAREVFATEMEAAWSIGLWRRHADGRWEQLVTGG